MIAQINDSTRRPTARCGDHDVCLDLRIGCVPEELQLALLAADLPVVRMPTRDNRLTLVPQEPAPRISTIRDEHRIEFIKTPQDLANACAARFSVAVSQHAPTHITVVATEQAPPHSRSRGRPVELEVETRGAGRIAEIVCHPKRPFT